jgi:hypothetical protein
MKKIILVLTGLILVAPAWAATVHLNSGAAVSGKIVETASDNVKVDVEGVTVTYYKDEITSIEGDEAAAKALGVASIGSTAPAAEVPAAAPAEPAVPPVVAAPAPAEPAVPPAVAAPAPVEPVAPAPTPVAVPPAAPSADKKEKILKFIEVFGTRDTMKLNFEQIMAAMPPEDAKKLKDAFNIDEVIQQLVPLYDKYFTPADLDGFIAFYTSPAGKKLVETIPLIMKESVDVSAKYFEDHMPADMKGEGAPPQQ